MPLRPPRLCVNSLICHSRKSGELSDRKVNLWTELSAKWFAQRHEGTKRLLRVFVSSCEPKSYRARKYRAMGSRFRGNDNFGVFGCVNGYSRRPELVLALPACGSRVHFSPLPFGLRGMMDAGAAGVQSTNELSMTFGTNLPSYHHHPYPPHPPPSPKNPFPTTYMVIYNSYFIQ
jgi:hypothetical protein